MSEPDDDEWLLLRERGKDVSHIPARTRAKYDQLVKLLEALPAETPSQGWKHRVLAALDDPPAHEISSPALDAPPAVGISSPAPQDATARDISTAPGRRRCRHTWTIVGGLAMAASFIVYSFGIPERRAARAPSHGEAPVVATAPVVTTETRRGAEPHRSGSGSGGDRASIGDILVVRAHASRPIELRVYGDTGEPLARCTETQGCTVERDGDLRRIHFELELRALGDVRVVLFDGAAIPASVHNLEADVDSATRANVDAHQVGIWHVQ
jgi:hypothetical protein